MDTISERNKLQTGEKDLCESCQLSWIAKGPGVFFKKCMFSEAWLRSGDDIADCNRYHKLGAKGNVTYHDPNFHAYEEEFENQEKIKV